MLDLIRARGLGGKWLMLLLIGSILLAALLAIAEAGLVQVGMRTSDGLTILVRNARYVLEAVLVPLSILIVGDKFLATRTTFGVTFDRINSDKIAIKGPDENNFVWIGRRYEAEFEAQSVAAFLQRRLEESKMDLR